MAGTMRVVLRLFLVGFLASGVTIVAGAPALACSCVAPVLRDSLREVDGAFVGRLAERIDEATGPLLSSGRDVTYVFDVERAIVGNIGDRVDVLAAADGASCGIEAREGARIGLLLSLEEGTWRSSLCAQVAPAELIRAARPLPAPDGVGPVRFLLGGDFGEARTLALDERGRTLGYGFGEGAVLDIDVCPGGRRSIETVSNGHVGSLVVRQLPQLGIVREVVLVREEHPSIYHVDCLDEAGQRALAIEGNRGVRVHEVIGDADRVVFEDRGRTWEASLVDGRPCLTLRGGRYGCVDLASGAFEELVRLPKYSSAPLVSPKGGWVATVRYGGALPGAPPSEIQVLSTAGGSPATLPLVFWNDFGRFRWLAEDRLLFLPQGEDVQRIAIYEVPSLREVTGADAWYASEAVVSGDVVTGVQFGQLVQVTLGEDARAQVLRTFEGDVYALAAVRTGVRPTPTPEIDASRGSLGRWIVASVALLAILLMIARRRASAR